MLAISCGKAFAASLLSSPEDAWTGTEGRTPDLPDLFEEIEESLSALCVTRRSHGLVSRDSFSRSPSSPVIPLPPSSLPKKMGSWDAGVGAPDGWVQFIRGPRAEWGAACQPPNRRFQPQAVCSVFLKVDGARPRGSTPAREKAQSTVTRLEKALEAMGDVQGPAVEVLKSELTKARAASKQPPTHSGPHAVRAVSRVSTPMGAIPPGAQCWSSPYPAIPPPFPSPNRLCFRRGCTSPVPSLCFAGSQRLSLSQSKSTIPTASLFLSESLLLLPFALLAPLPAHVVHQVALLRLKPIVLWLLFHLQQILASVPPMSEL